MSSERATRPPWRQRQIRYAWLCFSPIIFFALLVPIWWFGLEKLPVEQQEGIGMMAIPIFFGAAASLCGIVPGILWLIGKPRAARISALIVASLGIGSVVGILIALPWLIAGIQSMQKMDDEANT